MSKFSEESLLLIRDWDAYQDIMEAGERLKGGGAPDSETQCHAG